MDTTEHQLNEPEPDGEESTGAEGDDRPDGAPPTDDEGRGTEPADPGGPSRMRWTSALLVSVLAFCVWLVLDAPTLQHNAQVSPVGLRRTVALDLLGPIAALSRGVGLSHVVSVGDGVIGRHGNIPGNGSTLVSAGPKHPPVPTTTTSTVPGATTVPTAPTTTTLPATVKPTPSNPLRVLVIGDSLGIDLGNTLVNDLGNTGVVQATLDGQVGTGLTRPDYYNWPAELGADLPKYQPQVVIIMVGANDPQDFPGPPDVPFGSAQWSALYAQRVASFIQAAGGNGAQVVWVGMPPMQNPVLSQKMAALDAIYQAQSSVTGATFVSSWTVLGTPQGAFTPYLVSGGQEVNVREPDGTHIAPGGAEVLSQVVISALRAQLHIPVP